MLFWPTLTAICALFVCISAATTARKLEDAKLPKANPQEPKPLDALCLTPECIYEATRILRSMNSTVKPCDNFYDFVCGNYANSQSETVADAPMMSKLEVDLRLRRIIEDIDETIAPKAIADVKTSWKNCIQDEWKDDTAARLKAAKEIQETVEVWKLLPKYRTREAVFNYSSVFSYLLKFDTKLELTNASQLVLEVSFAPPPIPWSHLKEGVSNPTVKAYVMYITDILLFLGLNETVDAIDLLQIVSLDIQLARIVRPDDKNYDVRQQYTRTTIGELKSKYRTLQLKEFSGRDESSVVQMKMSSSMIKKVENWIRHTPKRELAYWLTWRWTADRVDQLGTYGPFRLRKLKKSVYGFVGTETKWRKCVQQVRSEVPFLLDVLYYGQYLRKSSVEDSTEIYANVKQQFIGLVQKAQWLNATTKQHALEKLARLTHTLGIYENLMLDEKSNVTDYGLELSNGLLADNRANLFIPVYSMALNTGSISKERWNFVLSMVHYFQEFIILNVGAAAYTDLFYNLGRPKALNYGAFGYLLGHEIAHSLDDTNRHVDKMGNLRPWWDSPSNETFVANTQCLVRQYEKYGSEDLGVVLNSFGTRDEDIADNVGTKAAYLAYDKWASENELEKQLPGLDYSPRQLFWIGFASTQCSKFPAQYWKTAFGEDDHSPSKLRVNVPLSNSPEFANDFKCRSGSKMNPVNKCVVCGSLGCVRPAERSSATKLFHQYHKSLNAPTGS